MKICYVLSYREPGYIRTKSILNALTQTPGIDIYEAINTVSGPQKYFETLNKVKHIEIESNPDIYILGFRGHEIYWPLRFLVGKKPIVIDALMSPYASLTQEEKFGLPGKLAGYLWRFIEESLLNNADLVLTDTYQHVGFYIDEFSLAPEKLVALPVGADESLSNHIKKQLHNNTRLNVLFYGSFLPLHGIDVILEAAARVRDLPFYFEFIGGNKNQIEKLKSTCEQLGVTQYTHSPWIPYEELINSKIPSADLCLGGPFGGTEQGKRVITGKTSQCLALGKPTIIGKIDEDIGLQDKINCLLVPQRDPAALAEALRWAYDQRNELSNIGALGKSLYLEKLSISVIRQRLIGALSSFPINS